MLVYKPAYGVLPVRPAHHPQLSEMDIRYEAPDAPTDTDDPRINALDAELARLNNKLAYSLFGLIIEGLKQGNLAQLEAIRSIAYGMRHNTYRPPPLNKAADAGRNTMASTDRQSSETTFQGLVNDAISAAAGRTDRA